MAAAERVAETLPIDGAEVPPRKRKRRGWAPDDTDRLVYQWVKFDGTSQSEVAKLLGIDQSTVSRIVQRYEKWQAHATPATDGRLSPEERQRAQRWLTHERNERILASCLRLAGEMERSIDASKSVMSRPGAEPSAERQVRTEYFVIDRTQMASRFLRLAQKINMDNLKLSEKEPLPELPPLADEEIAEQEAAAAMAVRERAAAEEAAAAKVDDLLRSRVDAEVAQTVAAEAARRMKEIERGELGVVGAADDVEGPVIRQSNERAVAEVQVHNVHKMHTCITPKPHASADAAESCEPKSPPTNAAAGWCMVTDESGHVALVPAADQGNAAASSKEWPRKLQPLADAAPPQREPPRRTAGLPHMTLVDRTPRPPTMKWTQPDDA